jgi:trans-aconitate methyltransferase
LIVDAKFESSSAFFEAKYQANSDPWDFSSDAYELGRYDAIIGAISHRHYRQVFEPGCSIGVLTERLAVHCEAVDAIDFSSTATAKAQARCAYLPHVVITCAAIPEKLPPKDTDLLILSEIGYYFTVKAWQQIANQMIDSVSPGTILLATHWLGNSKDHCISGDEVHQILMSHPKLQVEHTERTPNMRLDRLVRQ